MKLSSIQSKIVALAGVCLVIIASILVGYSLYASGVTQTLVRKQSAEIIVGSAKEQIINKGLAEITSVNAEFETAYSEAKALAQAISVVKMRQLELSGPAPAN